jgi:hypothetical protein
MNKPNSNNHNRFKVRFTIKTIRSCRKAVTTLKLD